MEMLMYCLAVYGASTLIVYEDGPWDIINRFRRYVGAPWHDIGPETGDSILVPGDGSNLGKLFSCRLCTGFWVGVAFLLLLVMCPVLLMPFAGVGFISLVQETNCGDR